ncbi:MAG: DUF3450 domain-containing protein [Pseudomonadales bacterium]|jgi:hypothetical protein|uniref:DUF3450 domain-containing protein n=1 Tax=uncultured Umboniibacter sp. TaxID=1798917 RepID=UPI002618C926|nr:DUF3450 domain-containing protein [uncultured Umboniibacter sp.]
MKKQRMKVAVLAAAVSGGALVGTSVLADELDNVLEVGNAVAQDGASSQQRVDAIQEQADSIISEYKQVNDSIDGLKLFNRQMQQSIDRQEASIANIEASIQQVTVMQRQMQPLTDRMLVALENFVALDMPFRKSEREQRIADLRDNMTDPRLTIAERFRQVLEAYKIENEYGRKIDHYSEVIDFGQGPKEMNVLQIGRVALMAQSSDQKTSIAFNSNSGQWEVLTDDAYRSAIIQGLRIAKKQAPADLMTIPAIAPEAAQ